MRKIFYTVFSISQICFLLLYPQEALAASKEGMQLWLNVLLPVLLPSDIDRNIDSYKYGRKTTAACGSDLE